MIPADFAFEDEFAFFDAAIEKLEIYEIYKKWMTEVAYQEVDRLLDKNPGAREMRPELIEAAMAPYDKAFQKYLRRDNTGSVSYTFSTYYRWWARQSAMLALNRG